MTYGLVRDGKPKGYEVPPPCLRGLAVGMPPPGGHPF